jgi:hypothetical protein
VHDEGDFFPEECAVSSYGAPFDEACDDVYSTVEDAIKEWCSKTGMEQGERTNEQMMDFINEYEYEDTEVYFYILSLHLNNSQVRAFVGIAFAFT